MRVLGKSYLGPRLVKIDGLLAFADEEGKLDDASDIIIVGLTTNSNPLKEIKKLTDVIVFYSETESEFVKEFDFSKSFYLKGAKARDAKAIFLDVPEKVPLYWLTKYESLIEKNK